MSQHCNIAADRSRVGHIGSCCPLCGTPVEDDASYVAHLAHVHDLVDDEGTTSHVPRSDDLVVAVTPASTRGADSLNSPRQGVRVYDPGNDDERLRPLVVGFGGLVLVLLLIGAFLVTG